MLNILIGETLGTMVLILLGNGVVANAIYKGTKGSKGGWIVITAGWGFAVIFGVITANAFGTGGHINPAVSLAFAINGTITLGQLLVYLFSQILGAALGQIIVSAMYWEHGKENDPHLVLASHCTGPTHPGKNPINFLNEFIGTMVLIGVVMLLPTSLDGAIMSFAGPITVGILVFSIGLSLGGPTGYAINPARDLIPRIIYHFTPYPQKIEAGWDYSWIPVAAPMLAGVVLGLYSFFIG